MKAVRQGEGGKSGGSTASQGNSLGAGRNQCCPSIFRRINRGTYKSLSQERNPDMRGLQPELVLWRFGVRRDLCVYCACGSAGPARKASPEGGQIYDKLKFHLGAPRSRRSDAAPENSARPRGGVLDAINKCLRGPLDRFRWESLSRLCLLLASSHSHFI